MKASDFLAQQDPLAFEEQWFAIPDRKEKLLAWIGRDQRVLDVGCLGGRIAELLRFHRNEVTGVELNPEAAQAALARGIHVVQADVEEGLPFPDREFDVVHVGRVLECLYDTKAFLVECRRVLRPGGQLLLMVGNVNRFENRWRILMGGYPAGVGAYPEDHGGEHLRVFNPVKLQELLCSVGFRVETICGLTEARSRETFFDRGLRLGSRLSPGLASLILVRARSSVAERA